MANIVKIGDDDNRPLALDQKPRKKVEWGPMNNTQAVASTLQITSIWSSLGYAMYKGTTPWITVIGLLGTKLVLEYHSPKTIKTWKD